MIIAASCGHLEGGGLLTKLENLQRDFTSRINTMGHLDYWQRLERLKMISISRRFERYKMVYSRKIIMGWVPNCGLEWDWTRKGCIFRVKYSPNSTATGVKSFRLNSFQIQGPSLYNILPQNLRDSRDSADIWKAKLDIFLETIPDTPSVTGLDSGLCDRFTSQPTNSVIKWMGLLARKVN